MNKLVFVVLVSSFLSLTSFASYIKPHSCRPQGEISAYCDCQFLSRKTRRNVFNGQVLCSILKCNDYTYDSAPEICSQGAKAVTCNLTNTGYAGRCLQTFPIVEKERSPQAVCDEVLGCLNNHFCIASYCSGTDIRQGWTLRSVIVEETTQR